MARARSLAEFQKSFPDEESCAAFLIKRRWQQLLTTAYGQLQPWQIAQTGRHLVQCRGCVGELLTHLRFFSAHPFEFGLFHSMSHSLSHHATRFSLPITHRSMIV